MIVKHNVIMAIEQEIAWEIENLGKVPEVTVEHQNGFIAGLQQAKATVMALPDT